MKLWQCAGLDLSLPDIRGVEYLLDMMAPEGLGWCRFDQMGGAEPVTWSEIGSFSREAGLGLEPWEAKQLRAMSAAYVHGLARGGEPLKVSPAFDDRPEEDPGVALERKRISESLEKALSQMAE
ncbi:MAG: hypothetical protein AB3N24_16875 [Leisingera sp.]